MTTETDLAPSTRLTTFDAAIRDLTDRRGVVYGPPKKNFKRIQKLKAIISECPDAAAREALECIAMKISRLIETPTHLDSWIDIAGYARTGVMATE